MRGARNQETGEVKYTHAGGTSNFRWLEAETVKNLGFEDRIDRRYYDILVDEAAAEIAKYGDLEMFLE